MLANQPLNKILGTALTSLSTRHGKDSLIEIGATQIGITQISASKINALQIGIHQGCVLQMGRTQIRTLNIRII